MPKKTIIIFITVFILVGGLMVGFYYFYNQSKNGSAGTTGTTGYNSFNPFSSGSSSSSSNRGTSTDTGTGNTTTGDQGNLGENASLVTPLHQITTFAVAGATYFEDMRSIPTPQVVTQPALVTTVPATPVKTTTKTTTKKGVKTKTAVVKTPPAPKFETVPALRYVERATGHVYERYLDTNIEGQNSNSTIPSIADTFFDSGAQSIIYRYISSIDNSISSFITTLGAAKSEFLPQNIVDISVSQDKTKYFYLTQNSNGVSGTVRSFNETKSTQVFSSPYTEWVSQWVGKDAILLTTKASFGIDGTAFRLTPSTGTLSKVFGGIRGLTTLASPDGSFILYSVTYASGPKLGIFDVKKHSTFDLGIASLAEKCVWSSDSITVYCGVPDDTIGSDVPDSWYQGEVSFNDSFIKVNTQTGQSSTITDSATGESVDAIKLFITKDESKLFFINKKDSTLWSLDLK